jgi:general secretion pathway protein M
MKLPAFFDRFGFATREQRNLTWGAIAALGLVFFVVPVGLQALAFTKRGSNAELREALQKVQSARNDIRLRHARKDSIVERYAKKAPQLAGYLDQTARSFKLEASDSNDRQEVAIGKRYAERNTVIHLRKAGMLPIARFVEAIEQSGYPVAVSRLNIRKRTGEPNSYDVEVGVSAFDRSEAARDKGKDGAASDSKPKDGK